MRVGFGWLLGISIVTTLCGIVVGPGDGSTANAGPAPSETVAWGDADCDGAIDTRDVLLLLEVTSGLPQSSNECTALHLGDSIVASPVFDTGSAQPAVIKVLLPFKGQFGNWDCNRNFNVFDALGQLSWLSRRMSGGTETPSATPNSDSYNDSCPRYGVYTDNHGEIFQDLPPAPVIRVLGRDGATSGIVCEPVTPGAVQAIGIFVEGVPAFDGSSGGLSGFAFDIHYDPTVLQVTEMDPQFMLIQGGPNNLYNQSDAIPDTDGVFHIKVHDNAANLNSGSGKLANVTFAAIGSGLPSIEVDDSYALDRDGKPDLFAAFNQEYPVGDVDNLFSADDFCHTTPSPTSTPVGHTSTPTATPTQTPVEPHGTLPFVGIDVDTTGNTATHVGSIETCRSIDDGEAVAIDIVAQGIPQFSNDTPLQNGTPGGLRAFGFELGYAPTALETFGQAHDAHFLIISEGYHNLVDFTEAPGVDDDGLYSVTVSDLGYPDSGDGVLIRVTLLAHGTGTSILRLIDLDVRDAWYGPYDVTTVGEAKIAVGQPCATPSPTPTVTPTPTITPTGSPTGTPTKTPSPTPTPAPHQCPSGSPVTILDNNPDGASVTRVVAGSGLVSSVAICLNIDHPWIGDLRVTLDNGSRTKIVMHRLSGGSGDCEGPGSFHGYVQDTTGNFLDTICPTTYTSYRPLEQFVNGEGSFENEPIAGNWTITVADLSSTNSSATGQITGFEIYLN